MARVLFLLWICFYLAACHVCSPGWTSMGSKCYLPISGYHQRIDAIMACSKRKARLVEVTNGEENTNLKYFLNQNKFTSAWLGVELSVNRKYWRYLSNNQPITFSNWDLALSDTRPVGCSAIYNDGSWRKKLCSSKHNFICQYV